MATRAIVVARGGSLERLPTSVASVSFWYIPGGYAYDQAEALMAYFDHVETAERFQQEHEMPPEMAYLEKL